MGTEVIEDYNSVVGLWSGIYFLLYIFIWIYFIIFKLCHDYLGKEKGRHSI